MVRSQKAPRWCVFGGVEWEQQNENNFHEWNLEWIAIPQADKTVADLCFQQLWSRLHSAYPLRRPVFSDFTSQGGIRLKWNNNKKGELWTFKLLRALKIPVYFYKIIPNLFQMASFLTTNEIPAFQAVISSNEDRFSFFSALIVRPSIVLKVSLNRSPESVRCKFPGNNLTSFACVLSVKLDMQSTNTLLSSFIHTYQIHSKRQ